MPALVVEDDLHLIAERSQCLLHVDVIEPRPGGKLTWLRALGSRFDHGGWMAEEIPFNAAQRTWERADIIVCGTPQIPYDPSTAVVLAPSPHPAADEQQG